MKEYYECFAYVFNCYAFPKDRFLKDIKEKPDAVKCLVYERIPDDIIDDKVKCKHFIKGEEEDKALF